MKKEKCVHFDLRFKRGVSPLFGFFRFVLAIKGKGDRSIILLRYKVQSGWPSVTAELPPSHKRPPASALPAADDATPFKACRTTLFIFGPIQQFKPTSWLITSQNSDGLNLCELLNFIILQVVVMEIKKKIIRSYTLNNPQVY